MSQQEVSPHLSTITETAKALRVSVRTVNTMLANGTIPSVRIGRRRLFNVATIIDLLERQAEVERAFRGLR